MNYFEPANRPLIYSLKGGKITTSIYHKYGHKEERENEDLRRYYKTHTIFGEELK